MNFIQLSRRDAHEPFEGNSIARVHVNAKVYVSVHTRAHTALYQQQPSEHTHTRSSAIHPYESNTDISVTQQALWISNGSLH